MENTLISLKEKVYLNDWLYNAGIVGFLRIICNDDIENQVHINIEDNFIEFDRQLLNGFSQKYFETAFKQYGRFNRIKKSFNEIIGKVNKIIAKESLEKSDEELISKSFETYKRLKTFTLMDRLLKENSIEFPQVKDVKKDPKLLIQSISQVLKIMEDNYQEFFESDVQIYLRKIYGQKSFLNNSVTKERYEKFYNDFEKPLIERNNKEEKKLKCLCCIERQAKKDINFDTGISPFFGINVDSTNFLWNFNSKLPICEICELIYFCYFAGFTDVSRGKEKGFYFVNNDSSVKELFKSNSLLSNLSTRNTDENLIVNFFAEFIFFDEYNKSNFILQNLSFIELDLTNDVFPKIHSLNISKQKAEFFKDEIENFKALIKTAYSIKDNSIYILNEVIELILKNKLGYNYLSKILKIYISSNNDGSNLYKSWFNSYHLQIINLLIFKFLCKVILRRNDMDLKDNEIWVIYNKGLDFSERLRQSQQENKINSLTYKLVNALRIGDINAFMDVIIRTHMANNIEIPSTFTKAISNKEMFFPVGYSFVNGLLGKRKDNKGENNG